MATGRPKSNLSSSEIAKAYSSPESSQRFPPVLSVEQAADLARVPTNTIYDWSSRGLLKEVAHRKGKRLRIFRDRFVQWLFE